MPRGPNWNDNEAFLFLVSRTLHFKSKVLSQDSCTGWQYYVIVVLQTSWYHARTVAYKECLLLSVCGFSQDHSGHKKSTQRPGLSKKDYFLAKVQQQIM